MKIWPKNTHNPHHLFGGLTDQPLGKKPSEQESRCLDLLLHHFHSTHSDVPVKFLMSNCPTVCQDGRKGGLKMIDKQKSFKKRTKVRFGGETTETAWRNDEKDTP